MDRIELSDRISADPHLIELFKTAALAMEERSHNWPIPVSDPVPGLISVAEARRISSSASVLMAVCEDLTDRGIHAATPQDIRQSLMRQLNS